MLPSLVSAAAQHDRRRARLLRKHYEMITGSLHRHHEYEDDHYWPLIPARAPLDADLGRRMEAQHTRIAALLGDLPLLWDRWVGEASPPARAALVAGLSELAAAVVEHLHDEEEHILPVLQRILSVEEWDDFGRQAARTTPKGELIKSGGIVLETIEPAELADLRSQLPLAVWLVEHVGAPLSRRYLARVRGER